MAIARSLRVIRALGYDEFRMAAAAPLAQKYRSLFVIGRGGMGSVEAAVQLEDDRVVALKRLLPDAARDKRRTEMFLREAKLAKLLDHPNVVRAYDYGEVDGELYLAMEYVEGQALSRVLSTLSESGEKLSPSLVAYVLSQVCEGLHAAHELKDASGASLNLVHRDVSPQNVMLAYDGNIRLLDFGVAKIETENVTKTGEVKGKTAYMSPEQAMGEPLDRRSDLFGVGAVLFECLALHRMWGDGTDMEIIRKLALEEPPALPGSAPEEMRSLYARLVARSAKDRPANAREVADALLALVPEGKEAAAKEIAKLLETHFASQAEDQRRRLTTSLRESGLPPAPVSVKPASPPKEEPKKSNGMIVFASIGLGLVAFLVYAWVQTSNRQPAPAAPASPPMAIVTSSAAPAASSSPPIASAEPIAIVSAATPTSKPSARPVASVAVKPKPSAVPTPSASATASAKPSDVITNPF
jgi:eukaryotic-like serine/threonine-protein kinase